MALDIELYRRTVFVPSAHRGQSARRISVIPMKLFRASFRTRNSL